jgi:transposase
MAMTIVEGARAVTGGVDTHLDVHVAAALDDIGGLLGVESFEASTAGNDKLLGWLGAFGRVTRVGVEGTGSYGAGLARFLRAAGVEVVEVDRPNRQARRRTGSPTRPTRWKPPGPLRRGGPSEWPRPETATWRPSGP